MNFGIILNPHAGRGTARQMKKTIEQAFLERGISFSLAQTEYPLHAKELARSMEAEVIVAVGGDGTVNEVANGLINTGKRLGIIPAGSGNDMVKSLAIPNDAGAALDILFSNNVSMIDVGRIRCSRKSFPEDSSGNFELTHFVNGVGIGFDAAVAVRTRQIRFLKGTLLYAVAVFQTLGKYTSPNFSISVDDSVGHASRNLLIAVGNGKCAGGGFYLTPEARPDDGLLDVCLIDEIPVRKILRVMPKVMKGRHLTDPSVEMMKVRKILVSASEEFFVHADGEIVGNGVNAVEIDLMQKVLPVLVGRQTS